MTSSFAEYCQNTISCSAGRPQSAGMDESNAAAADASIENVRQVYQAWLIVQLSEEPSSAFDYPQPVMGIAEGVHPH